MDRSQMLEVVAELLGILNRKKVSPNEAESIASIFGKAVRESNEVNQKRYMETAVFSGSPPKS